MAPASRSSPDHSPASPAPHVVHMMTIEWSAGEPGVYFVATCDCGWRRRVPAYLLELAIQRHHWRADGWTFGEGEV